MHHIDYRFKSDGRQAALAWQVHFPVRVRVQRPTGAQAVIDARRLVDEFRRVVEETEWPDARLVLLDPDADTSRAASEFAIEQKSKQEVRLHLTLTTVLTLEGTGAFWVHASAIAAASDLLQSFASRSHDKGIEVEIHQGRVVNKGNSALEDVPAQTT